MDMKKLLETANVFFSVSERTRSVEEMKGEVSELVLSHFDDLFAGLSGIGSPSENKAKEVRTKLKVIKNMRDIMCAELGLDPKCCEVVVGEDEKMDKPFCGPYPKYGCKEYCIISIPADNILNDNICEIIFQMRHELEHFRFNALKVKGEKVPSPIPATCMKYGEKGMLAYDANRQEFRCNNAGIKDLFAYLTGAKQLMNGRPVRYKNSVDKALKLMATYYQKELNEFCSIYYAAVKKGGEKYSQEIEDAERMQVDNLLGEKVLFVAKKSKEAVLNSDKSISNYLEYKMLYEKLGGLEEIFFVHESLYATKCLLCDYKYFDGNVYNGTDKKIRYVLMVPEKYYQLSGEEFAQAIERDIDNIAKEVEEVGELE